MLSQRHEMLAQHRSSRRWKEWIPLVSQQLRLRNLIQVIAFNVNLDEKQLKCDIKSQKVKAEALKSSFYYTLHLTTMSAPFYTSERLEGENPKWAEIEINAAVNSVNASVNGIVIRLWVHRKSEQDQVLTVWGVYFSGLMYLGPKLCSDPTAFCFNTIIFHMHGGYFTAPQCVKDHTKKLRHSKVVINAADVRPSYTVNLVSRLHTIQQAIKKQMSASQMLREKISVGGYSSNESRESATLRRLLNKTRPQAPQRQEILKIQRELEVIKFRVEMLTQERSRKLSQIQHLDKVRSMLYEVNQDRGIELMNNYQSLHKEIEQLKEKKKVFIDARETFLHANSQLIFRQKQLISKLNQIYPVVQISKDKFTIGGVHLPNSEDFAGDDEFMISVSLGYVAHVAQMISIFLQVPLRYPVIHFGSWSKIVDNVSDKIPEKDREFPLFSRGKDKLQFHYGVYLLNKNVAQLRWYCGLPTQDLRATLPNISGLLHLQPACNILESYRNVSSASLDIHSSSWNQSPVSHIQTEIRKSSDIVLSNNFQKGHRISKSMGSSEIKSHVKDIDVDQSGKEHTILKTSIEIGPPLSVTNLSYSLDKGLDQYEGMKKVEDTSGPSTVIKQKRHSSQLGYVRSEPILTHSSHDAVCARDEDETSSADEAKKHFLQNWEAGGGSAPIFSDDDTEIQDSHSSTALFSHDKNSLQNIPIMNSSDDLEDKNKLSTNEIHPIACQSINGGSSEKNLLEGHSEIKSEDSFICAEQSRVLCSYENGSAVDSVEIPREDPIIECSVATSFPLSLSSFSETCRMNSDIQEKFENKNEVSLEEITHFIDNSFANVASRTEALANRSGSFNLVRSKHGSFLEDGGL